MTGIFTLSIIVFLLFATYTVISRDLIHPLYVYLAGAFTVVLMSIIMTNILDYNITSPIYKFIFLFSFIFFTFFFLQKIIKKKEISVSLERFHINRRKMQVLSFFSIVIFILILIDYISVVGFTGLTNLSTVINEYRVGTTYGDAMSISSFSKQLFRILKLISFISVYILFFDYNISKHLKRKYFFYLVAPYIVIGLIQGQRFGILILIIYTLILWLKKSGHSINVKKAFKIILIISGAIILFSLSRHIVGRSLSKGTIEYVASYFGNSVINFDWFYNHQYDTGRALNYGLSTFNGILDFLQDIGVYTSEIETHYSSFVYLNPNSYVSTGNVFTSFVYYLYDFGVLGVFIFPLIIAAFSNILYRKNKYIGEINIGLILYAILSSNLFMETYTSTFLGQLISEDFVITVFFLYCICTYLTSKQTNGGY